VRGVRKLGETFRKVSQRSQGFRGKWAEFGELPGKGMTEMRELNGNWKGLNDRNDRMARSEIECLTVRMARRILKIGERSPG
jgi:hypothetical protein